MVRRVYRKKTAVFEGLSSVTRLSSFREGEENGVGRLPECAVFLIMMLSLGAKGANLGKAQGKKTTQVECVQPGETHSQFRWPRLCFS